VLTFVAEISGDRESAGLIAKLQVQSPGENKL
jgi:hypothetical protein